MNSDATDGQTMLGAIKSLEAAGFTSSFHVVPGAEPTVKCDTCGATMPAATIEILEIFRLEGESDPADEAIVAGVRCVSCGCRGVLVATYGPAADPADADTVVALTDHRRRAAPEA
ncbi:MAG: hypothetical protein ACRDZ3_07255 [Acidimicrobiia bacterium]